MNKYILYFLLIPTLIHAKTFKIAGQLVDFKLQNELQVANCKSKCDALKFTQSKKKINLTILRKDQKFHNSIGSDVCKLAYKQSSVLGIDVEENGDGRAFCVFPDRSMVEINSLSDYLEKKKLIQ